MWYHCKVIVLVFGKVMGMGAWRWCRDGFLELVRGFCGDWDRECAEWVEKA